MSKHNNKKYKLMRNSYIPNYIFSTYRDVNIHRFIDYKLYRHCFKQMLEVENQSLYRFKSHFEAMTFNKVSYLMYKQVLSKNY